MLAHLAVNGKSRACVNGLAQLRPARPVQHAVVRKERGRVAHEALEAVVAPVGLLLEAPHLLLGAVDGPVRAKAVVVLRKEAEEPAEGEEAEAAEDAGEESSEASEEAAE